MKVRVKPKNFEKFLYAGCMHGYDVVTAEKLLSVEADYAFFSDITGSSAVERTKRVYYEELAQVASPLIDNGLSDATLLKYTKSAFHKLYRQQLEWEGKSQKEISADIENLSPEFIAKKIRHFVGTGTIQSQGKWIASLSIAARRQVLEIIAQDTKKFIDVLIKMQKKGTKIIVVEGNWDSINTLEQFASGDGKNPVTHYFNTEKYMKKRGIHFVREFTGLVTKTSFHILAPFYSMCRKYNDIPKTFLRKLSAQTKKARKEGKVIVLYAHGVPYPEYHDLTEKKPITTKSNLLVSETLRKLMILLEPEEVVYSHYHELRVDAENKKVPINRDIISRVDVKNAPVVGEATSLRNYKSGVFTTNVYVPFRRIALGDIDHHRESSLSTFLPAKVIQ